MRFRMLLQNGFLGATAALFVGSRYIPGAEQTGPVVAAAAELVMSERPATDSTVLTGVAALTHNALNAFATVVRPLSHPRALETAFRSYFAYKAEHPGAVAKPYLYFVDYGQPNTAARGYVFDMSSLELVDGPFTVAAGRGSAQNARGIPTRFSNQSGSAATSLGLYLAQETYGFSGKSAGRRYSSVGLRLKGLSGRFNDNARARGVVAHGAPYVTASKAGRSEGCPAMEEGRARRLLPKIAEGGMVFLFAPEQGWLDSDPWLTASAE